jgi:hypothetical protein
MRYRKLSPTGDYTFGNGQKDFWINQPDGVAQAIQTGLKLFRGEWYLDSSQGTPWFDGVLGVFSQSSADLTLQTQIQNTIGVVNIAQFQSITDPQTRRYSLSTCIVNTQFGPTSLQIMNYRNY